MACLIVPTMVDYYGVGARQRDRLTADVARVQRLHGDLQVDEVAIHTDPRDALLAEAVGG